MHTTYIKCYTPDDVSKILNISKAQSYRLFNSEIPGVEFPSFRLGRSWRITKQDFIKWVKKK